MLSRLGRQFLMSALAFVLTVAAGTVSAQSTKAVINAGAMTSYPPFQYKDPTNNELKGFDIDLLNAMAEKMGVKVNWIESSFPQLLSSVETKRLDILVNMADIPERRASVSFVDYQVLNAVFYTTRANASRLPNMSALCGKRVAAARSQTYVAWVGKWSDENCTKLGKPAIAIVTTDGTADSRLQLAQGRVDAAADPESVVAYSNQLEDNRYAVVGKPFNSQFLGIGFSKDDQQLGQALKKSLSAVIADGTYQRLQHKWNVPANSAIRQPMINGQL